MSLSRFITPTFASIEIANPEDRLSRESDLRWTSAGKSLTVTAEEGGDVLLSASKVILGAASDLQNLFLNFPGGDLPAGSEIVIIPQINVAAVEVRGRSTLDASNDGPTQATIVVLPDDALTSLTKYQPVRFTLLYQKEPFKQVWVKS